MELFSSRARDEAGRAISLFRSLLWSPSCRAGFIPPSVRKTGKHGGMHPSPLEAASETPVYGEGPPFASPGIPGEGQGEGDFEHRWRSTFQITITPTLPRSTTRRSSSRARGGENELPKTRSSLARQRRARGRGSALVLVLAYLIVACFGIVAPVQRACAGTGRCEYPA